MPAMIVALAAVVPVDVGPARSSRDRPVLQPEPCGLPDDLAGGGRLEERELVDDVTGRLNVDIEQRRPRRDGMPDDVGRVEPRVGLDAAAGE